MSWRYSSQEFYNLLFYCNKSGIFPDMFIGFMDCDVVERG